MIETRASRLVALCVLLGLLLGIAVWFGVSTSQGPWPGEAPTVDHLAASDEAYVDRHVHVSGTVVRTDPVVVVARYERWTGSRYRTGVLGFPVTGLTTPVAPGRALQVYGTLAPDGTIRATNGVVVPSRNIVFMYGVSALAGLWVLARLVRGWTVDRSTLAAEPRSTPLVTLGSSDTGDPEESTDA